MPGQKIANTRHQPSLQFGLHQLTVEALFIGAVTQNGFVIQIVPKVVAHDVVVAQPMHAGFDIVVRDSMLGQIDFPGAIVERSRVDDHSVHIENESQPHLNKCTLFLADLKLGKSPIQYYGF